MTDTPLYFRIKSNGATVMRIVENAQSKRTMMEPLASANHRNGDIRALGEAVISNEEMAAITAWIEDRKRLLLQRNSTEADLLCEQLGLTAQWIRTDASDEEIARLSDQLLWGMHDLRAALIRRIAALPTTK